MTTIEQVVNAIRFKLPGFEILASVEDRSRKVVVAMLYRIDDDTRVHLVAAAGAPTDYVRIDVQRFGFMLPERHGGKAEDPIAVFAYEERGAGFRHDAVMEYVRLCRTFGVG